MLKMWTLPDTCMKFVAVAGEASSRGKVFTTKGNYQCMLVDSVKKHSFGKKNNFVCVLLYVVMLQLIIVTGCC